MLSSKKRLAVAGGLLVLGILRFSIVGEGALAFEDELFFTGRFHRSATRLLERDWNGVAAIVYDGISRPGAYLIALLPTLLERTLAVSRTGQSLPIPEDQQFHLDAMIPSHCYIFLEIVASLVITWLIFWIGLVFFEGDLTTAAIAAASHAALLNSNLYLRHVFSYDFALAFHLASVALCLRGRVNSLSAAVAGVLSAFGFSTYPGFYWLTGFAALLLISSSSREGSKVSQSISFITAFFGGFASLLLAHEGVSRAFNQSYFIQARGFMATITQGDFTEGFSFPWKYVLQVEGGLGIALLAGLTFAGIRFIHHLIRRELTASYWKSPIAIVAISLVGAYLYHASSSFLFHHMVYYGRLLHAYFPLVCWLAVGTLIRGVNPRFRRFVSFAFAGLITVSLINFASGFGSLAYPYQVGRDYGGLKPTTVPRRFNSDWSGAFQILPVFDETGLNATTSRYLFFSNLVQLTPHSFGEHLAEAPRPTREVYFEGPHFLNFPAYQFEGYGAAERELLRKNPMTVRVTLVDEQK